MDFESKTVILEGHFKMGNRVKEKVIDTAVLVGIVSLPASMLEMEGI